MTSLLEGTPVRPARFALVALAVVANVAASAPTVGAPGARARRASDTRWGISIEAPPGWTIAQRTGFAETIFLLLSPDGSRISLSAQATPVHSTAELVEQNRRGLASQGFIVAGSAAGPAAWRALDLEAPRREEKLRQLYLVRPGAKESQALVLTLVAPAKAFALHVSDLAFVVERMSIEEAKPAAADAAGGAGGGVPLSRGGAGIEPRHRSSSAEHAGQP